MKSAILKTPIKKLKGNTAETGVNDKPGKSVTPTPTSVVTTPTTTPVSTVATPTTNTNTVVTPTTAGVVTPDTTIPVKPTDTPIVNPIK